MAKPVSGLFTHKPTTQTGSRGTGAKALEKAAQQDRLNSLPKGKKG